MFAIVIFICYVLYVSNSLPDIFYDNLVDRVHCGGKTDVLMREIYNLGYMSPFLVLRR